MAASGILIFLHTGRLECAGKRQAARHGIWLRLGGAMAGSTASQGLQLGGQWLTNGSEQEEEGTDTTTERHIAATQQTPHQETYAADATTDGKWKDLHTSTPDRNETRR